MDMDHLIGPLLTVLCIQRFNLISKSEIRYVGTLHEINPEQSTIALEDVYSFGTEGRASKDFIPASSQKFDYIVFRGTDVKDIKIAEEQKENKQPESNVPNDPAILNASRPGQSSPQGPPHNQPPFPQPNFPQHPQHQQPPPFQNYYPQYNRGYGPPPAGFPPGPGFQGMPYGPPPPGYFGPAGQNFLPNHGPFPPPPPQMPLGQPDERPLGGAPQRPQPGPQAPNELPVNDRAQEAAAARSSTPFSNVSPAPGPTPPVDSKPSVSEALAPVSTATAPVSHPAVAVPPGAKALPSGPKNHRVVPALPMTVNSRSSAPLIPATTNGPLGTAPGNASQPTASKPAAPTQVAMEEANRQARAAVANAMAKMNTGTQPTTAQPKPVASGNPVDVLTKKVGEMRTSDGPRGVGPGSTRGQRGSFRGSQNHGRKMDLPKSEFDFESANAKFNKEDMIKEAIASGSPIGEPSEEGVVNGSVHTGANGEKRKDTLPPLSTEAYNRSSSFFDNISSEAKDREDGANQQMGRVGRGEEIKKNMETFGQGSVDSGFRGRGRGGFRGRGRPYGGQRGYGGYGRGGGQRGRGRGGAGAAQA